MKDYCKECGKLGRSPCDACAELLIQANGEMVHPAKAIQEFVEELCNKQERDVMEEKPLLSYSRNTTWHGEPCHFCNRSKLIHLVNGRYIYAEVDEEMEFVEGTQVYFCGDCLSLLSLMTEESME
jgi:hypothetical protein